MDENRLTNKILEYIARLKVTSQKRRIRGLNHSTDDPQQRRARDLIRQLQKIPAETV